MQGLLTHTKSNDITVIKNIQSSEASDGSSPCVSPRALQGEVGSIGKSKDFRSEDAENSSDPNMTIVLVNQMVNYQCTSSGCHKGDVAMPNQLEPWLLDLPEGVKETDPYQQMAARETECVNIIFPLHLI